MVREIIFPPTSMAMTEPDGLLATGGDLELDTLLSAYSQGVFPWFSEDEPICWWAPSQRAVLVPSRVHLSKNLRKQIRRDKPYLRCNENFERIITACSRQQYGKEQVWITESMQHAYTRLKEAGACFSIEAFIGDRLVGGFYGVKVGKVFCGESMISFEANGSKIALALFCQVADALQIELIDCQILSEHIERLGAEEIPRKAFEQQLKTLGKGGLSAAQFVSLVNENKERI